MGYAPYYILKRKYLQIYAPYYILKREFLKELHTI